MTDNHYHDSDLAESFFMTNHLSPKLTSQYDHSRLEFDSSTLNLQHWYQATEEMLNHRRQRAIMHTKKMKEIEEEYEKRKESKEKSLQEKIQYSQTNKRKGISLIQERLRKISERRNKIKMEVKNREHQTLQKKLQERKTFEPGGSKHRGSISRGSQSSHSEERIKVITKELYQAQSQIKNKLDDYEQRQKHAQYNNLLYNQIKAQRARSHNIIDVPQVKQRAVLVKAERIRAQSQDAITRLSTLNIVRNNKQKQEEKVHSKKQKHNSEKIQRFNHHLLDLKQKDQRKYTQLEEKHDKIIIKSTWRDPRKSSQNKRILQNLQALENAQKRKTERLLSKHEQIDQRNKIFRERRALLFQNYKNQTIF